MAPWESMAISGDDSAFPSPISASGGVPGLPGREDSGLTKREYFAVHLFEGVVSRLSVNCTLQDKAKYAVEAADALIKALAARSEE